MTGMLTGDRMVRLEVAGLRQQHMSRTSNYSVTIPYGSMSSAMQNITRLGGKVVGVRVSDAAVAATPSVVSKPIATTEVKVTRTPAKSNKGKRK
jgi:CpcD/allophycocyanin linker domain